MKTLNILSSLLLKKRAVITVIVIVSAVSFSSCNPIKAAEKRIKSSQEGINNIGQLWAKTHPCANDTLYANKADTITMLDTSYQFLTAIPETSAENKYVHDTLREVVRSTRYVHDTVTNNIVDTRALNIQKQKSWQDASQLNTLQASLLVETTLAKKRWWIIFVIIAIAVIVIVIAVWLKLKSGMATSIISTLKSKV